MRILVLGAVALVGLGPAMPASADDQNVSAVWSREDDYWRFVKAGDVENYLTLWHEDFVGWPCHEDHPAGKSAIGRWVREIRDKRVTFTADLTREAAQDFGNIVVVYYRSTMVSTFPDGRVEGRGQTSKFTHTWMKVGGSWQNHRRHVRQAHTAGEVDEPSNNEMNPTSPFPFRMRRGTGTVPVLPLDTWRTCLR